MAHSNSELVLGLGFNVISVGSGDPSGIYSGNVRDLAFAYDGGVWINTDGDMAWSALYTPASTSTDPETDLFLNRSFSVVPKTPSELLASLTAASFAGDSDEDYMSMAFNQDMTVSGFLTGVPFTPAVTSLGFTIDTSGMSLGDIITIYADTFSGDTEVLEQQTYDPVVGSSLLVFLERELASDAGALAGGSPYTGGSIPTPEPKVYISIQSEATSVPVILSASLVGESFSSPIDRSTYPLPAADTTNTVSGSTLTITYPVPTDATAGLYGWLIELTASGKTYTDVFAEFANPSAADPTSSSGTQTIDLTALDFGGFTPVSGTTYTLATRAIGANGLSATASATATYTPA